MNRLLILLLLSAITIPSSAQLTIQNLHQLLQYADQHGLTSRQSALNQEISQNDIKINQSGLFPKVNVFATGDYYPLIPVLVVPQSATGGASDKFQKVQFGLPWSFSGGVEVSMPVINLAKWEELRKYRLQSEQTGWDSKANEENLHIQLTQTYYQALLAKALIQLSRSEEEISIELLRILEQRKNNQLVDPADYNRSRNLELDTRSSLIESEENYQLALVRLRELLHLPAAGSLVLEDSISAPDWTIAPEEVLPENRPGLKSAAARIQVAEQQYKQSKKAGLPALSLNGKFTYQSQFDPSQKLTYVFSNIGLRLDFPIFQGSFYKTSREKSELQLELARISQDQTADQINRQQAEWRTSYESAVKKQDVLQQKLLLTGENLRIARISMKEGVMEYETFNSIFREYIAARMSYLQNLNDGLVYNLLLTQKW
jgi:outer membrane protein TolC